MFLGSPSVQAIYLDDELSGFEIYNNTFTNCHVRWIGGQAEARRAAGGTAFVCLGLV